jgi:hypothetical protein
MPERYPGNHISPLPDLPAKVGAVFISPRCAVSLHLRDRLDLMPRGPIEVLRDSKKKDFPHLRMDLRLTL